MGGHHQLFSWFKMEKHRISIKGSKSLEIHLSAPCTQVKSGQPSHGAHFEWQIWAARPLVLPGGNVDGEFSLIWEYRGNEVNTGNRYLWRLRKEGQWWEDGAIWWGNKSEARCSNIGVTLCDTYETYNVHTEKINWSWREACNSLVKDLS